MQKIFDNLKTCPQKNRMESESYVGGQTFMWITENNRINNLLPIGKSCKLKNRRIRDPYVRWCERTDRENNPYLPTRFGGMNRVVAP